MRDDMLCGPKSLARCLSCPAFSRKPLELHSDSWHAGKEGFLTPPTPTSAGFGYWAEAGIRESGASEVTIFFFSFPEKKYQRKPVVFS